MQIITGPHKKAYHDLLFNSAYAAAQVLRYKEELAYCKALIVELNARVAAERARAERAIDELLMARGQAPVTPPPIMPTPTDDLFMEDPVEVEKLERRIQAEGIDVVLKDEA